MSGPVPFTKESNSAGGAGQMTRLKTFVGSFPSVGGVDTDIFSFSIPAGTLANPGDTLKINFWGKSTGAEVKTARTRIGAIEIAATAMTTAANGYYFQFVITRKAATNDAYVWGLVTRATGGVQSIDNNSVAIDWTVANTFLVRLQTVTNGTIEMLTCQIDKIAAEA